MKIGPTQRVSFKKHEDYPDTERYNVKCVKTMSTKVTKVQITKTKKNEKFLSVCEIPKKKKENLQN